MPVPGSSGSEADVGEVVIWTGRPSVWQAWRGYLTSVVIVGLAVAGGAVMGVVPGGWWLAVAATGLIPGWVGLLGTLATRYELTTQRLLTRRGILVQRTDELELYRVRDLVLIEPIWWRVLGRGHVLIKSSDVTTPELMLYAIAQPASVRQMIRQQVEQVRDAKGVRTLDVD